MSSSVLDKGISSSASSIEKALLLVSDPKPIAIVAKTAQVKLVQSKLFGIENQTSRELDLVVAREERMQSLAKINDFAADNQVGILDHTVLDWRDRDGMPLLVPFSIGSDEFSIRTSIWSLENSDVTWGSKSVPGFIRKHYHDVFDKLRQPINRSFFGRQITWDDSVSGIIVFVSGMVAILGLVFWLATSLLEGFSWLSTSWLILVALGSIVGIPFIRVIGDKKYASRKTAVFDGVIPDDARSLIQSKQAVFDGIIILAEASGWQTEITKLPRVDPLILGYKFNQLFYIGKFDPVTLTESFVAKEFAANPS